jgi:hypothetical protein
MEFSGAGVTSLLIQLLAENLSGLKEADQLIAQPHWHRRVTQTKRASQRGGIEPGILGEFLLNLQAGGAGFALIRQKRAQRIFIGMPVIGQLPGFNRSKRNRQTGSPAERMLVILIDPGIGQPGDKILILLAVQLLVGGRLLAAFRHGCSITCGCHLCQGLRVSYNC